MKRWLLCGLLISCTVGVKADWYSNLYPANWVPGYTYGTEQHFLHDFSYAGYRMGIDAIPQSVGEAYIDVTEAPYNADKTGTNDATAAIQNAINAVSALGGGTVYLPEGTFKVRTAGGSSALKISSSNIILRGAGKGRTFIRCYEENMRNKQIILIDGGGSWDTPEDGKTYRFTSDIGDTPSKEIFLDDITGLTLGTWVIIRSDRSSEWIAEHSMGGFWSPNTTMGVTFYRQITGINREAKSITIDIPTRYPVKMRDNARVYKVTPKLSNVGLENFSIGNKMNPVTFGWGEEDYNTSGNGGYQVHSAFLIKFSHAVNSWARNIASYHADNPANTSFGEIHMSSNGMDLNQCRSLTIENCDFSYPQYEGGGGNGYGLNLCSEDCLFKNYSSTSSRHAFAFKYAYSNGNVFVNCTATNAKYASDFHMYFSMSNLIDNYNLDGDFIESSVRPYGANAGNYHGITSSQTVFWNSNGLKYKGNNYIIDSRQHGYGYIIGTRGAASGVKTTPTYISTKYGNVETAPEDYKEGIGQGASLATPSLYDSQLWKRQERESTALDIPATIEAEKFKSVSNLRAEAYNGGFTLTSRTNGAWAEYYLNAPQAGKYRITLRMAGLPTGAVEIRQGASVLSILIPQNTDNYTTYADNSAELDLPEGLQTLRVNFTGSQLNFDQLIIEFLGTGIKSVAEARGQVYVQNFHLYFDGYPDNVNFTVYSVSGQKITSDRAFALHPGVYIVRVQTLHRTDSHKVIVN
ncbi:MAG: carbohydrate-binding protein [Dysgonamonadaceae bacterium]|jgi:hypothetical protein|nr:carbohydrate-binding protein [Dysgonamonadaceae bacterium]